MNKKFVERLTEYLDSECSDYGMIYDWEWNEDTEHCEVEVTGGEKSVCLFFSYNEENDELSIDMGEDCYEVTREFDYTVKYFWIKVAPDLFSNN